ncbi:hypothetical protein FFWV33_02670 [Flavobacterium faecale]|uniref:Laminin G domain-containing protein n=1 Tax=Flavobacterium faecale TaxID=1355330 RepID=A0A2S1L9S5_9FLAO|nr:Ig-like domain-containing protein [Flavobacterium faecale]AWG20509.1 hypothetical protein FFWV33_02670 [Flavobacterium faecale]
MKTTLLFCTFLFLSSLSTVKGQTYTFNMNVTPGNSPSKTETINGVTMTFAANGVNVYSDDFSYLPNIDQNAVGCESGSTSATFTFSSAINITSIVAGLEDTGKILTFTPTGGSNSTVNQSINNFSASIVPLNWKGVTKITITAPSQAYFVFDKIIFSLNTAPAISGTVASQTVNDNSTLLPFSGITTTDADGDNLSATITLDTNAKGILSGAGLSGTGPYTIASTTAANLQATLRALTYNPTDNRTTTSETTTFTIAVNDGTATTSNNTTTVISSAVKPTATITLADNALSIGETSLVTITFSEAVTGFTNADLTIANGTLTSVSSSNGGITWTATFTPTNNIVSATNVISLDKAGVADSAGNTGSEITNSPNYSIDTTSSLITSVAVPPNATYTTSQNLNFTVTFSKNIIVNTTGGVPQIGLTIGSTIRQAVYTSGSGTNALLFSYTVQNGELDTDGITVGNLVTNGGTIKDNATNNATLTLNSVGTTNNVLVNSVTPATHLNFDGVNDYVSINNITTASFTLEAYIKTTTNSPGGVYPYQGVGILDSDVGGPANDFTFTVLNNKLSFWDGNANQNVNGITTVVDGNWHHVAVVRTSGTSIKVYVDGVLDGQVNVAGTAVLNSNSKIYIGSSKTDNRYFNGSIDDVRIWNSARTAEQINASKNCELQGNEASLVSYYKFNQGNDAANNSGITTLTDATSNANNGTLTNLALTGATSNWLAGSPVVTGSTCTTLSTKSFSKSNSIKVYPNPTSDSVTIEASTTDNATVQVSDSTGRILVTKNLSNATNTVDLSQLQQGVYIFKVKTKDGESVTKVVKQ